MNKSRAERPVLVAGGGIGGLAAALALSRQGLAVKVLEQAPEIGEIGAGIQLGPNAFAAFDALGIGEATHALAVYTAEMVMFDVLDETLVGRIPREAEAWSIREGSKAEVESYFQGICPRARQLIDLPKSWKRWATADREPIAQWTFGHATLLGDAAHPMLPYLAQGACMALEDAVTLGEALRVSHPDFAPAFDVYQRSRVTRTARVVLSAREMGRIFHAKGVERLVRNALWKGRSPERLFDAMEWLYGWRVENCLAH